MFAGLTAWFSASIGNSKKQKWLDHGGKEAPLDDAEYIFSADAGCEDTERIFNSEPYLDEHLAVFHPNYIDECIKQGGPKEGLLGKYFLPPKDVQKLVRAQLTLQWDVDGHTSDSDLPKSKPKTSDQPQAGTSSGITHSPRKSPSGNTQTRAQSAPTSKPVSQSYDHLGTSHQSNNHPGTSQQSTNQKAASNQSNNHPGTSHQSNNHPGTNHQTNNHKAANDQSTNHKAANNQSTNHKAASNQSTNHKAASNMADRSTLSAVQQEEEHEYLRLEDLAQSAGELFDFVPGRDGCDMVIK